MIAALFILLAAPQEKPKSFAEQCFERAKGQAELNFCSAGQAEATKLEIADAEAVACFDREMSQMGMNRCAAEEYERADKRLNTAWAKAKASAKDDPQSAKLLLESQRSWIRFRDAQCALEADENRGGSIVPLVELLCMTNLTGDRIKALAQMADPEGQ